MKINEEDEINEYPSDLDNEYPDSDYYDERSDPHWSDDDSDRDLDDDDAISMTNMKKIIMKKFK